MPNNQDICPISDTGTHRYFIYKVVDVFEPYQAQGLDIIAAAIEGKQLYEKVEYALMGCNCGSAIKKKVEQR